MQRPSPWIQPQDLALLTDLYELTMLQAYWREGMDGEAVFSLFFRTLPQRRNFMLACGLEDALAYLEGLGARREGLDYLARQDQFRDDFLEWLGELRFTGDVWAVPEGTPVFPDEPILEVVAPLPQAQLAEPLIMNQIHHQTVVATKAARVVEAARGRAVVDFGLRRMHGTDAAIKAARAFHVAGVAATSNVYAGWVYDLPIAGTMAHSYIQAHDDEMAAFREFTELYPETVLLVDTYETLEGVRKVIRLAREKGADFGVKAVRLDSGDLAELARESRRLLDEAGLEEVRIFASGGLDEDEIDRLLAAGAPIDAFGVGTKMGASEDASTLDMAYKLTAYEGEGRLKTSTGKATLPGRKQVFRIEEEGRAVRDVIARAAEELPGRPLLAKVMRGGKRLAAGRVSLDEARKRTEDELDRLPDRLRGLAKADPPYEVDLSPGLERELERARERVKI